MDTLTPDMLVGHWVSAEREPMQNPDGSTTYIVRDFTLDQSNWKLLLTGYGDPSADVKVFEATIEGAYRLVGSSEKVEDATEAEFDFDKVSLTPYMQPVADMLVGQHAGSGTWTVGETQDISATGGLVFGPTAQYAREYDLLKLDGNKLYFGQRPADNNMGSADRRPTALTTAPVVKQ